MVRSALFLEVEHLFVESNKEYTHLTRYMYDGAFIGTLHLHVVKFHCMLQSPY